MTKLKIEVKAAGLNFYDLIFAPGQIFDLGIEYSGNVRKFVPMPVTV